MAVLLALVIAWLLLLTAGSLVCGGGRLIAGRLLAGYLLYHSNIHLEISGEYLLLLAGRSGWLLLALLLACTLLGGISIWLPLALMTVGVSALILLSREDPIMDGLIETHVLLHLSDGYMAIMARVQPGGALGGLTLAHLDLRRKGLLVLAVKRAGEFIQFPKGSETLHDGDILVLYGRLFEADSHEA